MEIALNLYISFDKMAIFTVLILPIHEHGKSFHLLRSFPITFITYLKFLPYRFFIFLELHQGMLYYL